MHDDDKHVNIPARGAAIPVGDKCLDNCNNKRLQYPVILTAQHTVRFVPTKLILADVCDYWYYFKYLAIS